MKVLMIFDHLLEKSKSTLVNGKNLLMAIIMKSTIPKRLKEL